MLHAPFVGRDEVASILRIPAQVFGFDDSFRYTQAFVDGDDQALFFEAQIEGLPIDGVDLIRLNGDGQVAELRVMIRPLPQLQRYAEIAAQLLGAADPAVRRLRHEQREAEGHA